MTFTFLDAASSAHKNPPTAEELPNGSSNALAEALHDRSPFDVPAGAWTPAALLVSSAAFAAGHLLGEWPAAFAYGLLMAALWVWRGDLLTCVVAHGTTNVTLAFWVRATRQWALW